MSFQLYNPEDSVTSSEIVVRGLWSGDANTLVGTSMITGSLNTGSIAVEYFLDVYNGTVPSTGSSVQFSIQYGHVYGSGSSATNPGTPTSTPSKTIYGQYRNLVYGTEDIKFNFNGADVLDIFIINIARERYKESIKPGSLELSLNGGSGTLILVDDSSTSLTPKYLGENRYYNIVSTTGSTTITRGILLPDLGIIILDPTQLNGYITTPNRTAATSPVYNFNLLYNSVKSGNSFKLQSSETISSRFFFTRIKNADFNYTTNPSIIDANGNLLYSTLIDNPQTFVTTVGLYNNMNELLAVAKLSKPLVKDFTKEQLIRVKMDY